MNLSELNLIYIIIRHLVPFRVHLFVCLFVHPHVTLAESVSHVLLFLIFLTESANLRDDCPLGPIVV